MATSKYYSLIDKLLNDAKEANVSFSIIKLAKYCYLIKFQQPWFVKEIEVVCEEELIEKYIS